jgi:putative ABC transport system permease protein
MFYLQYAMRNLWRNRRWSSFAVFSIAAGVATIVALRSLGLAIGDSLTSNVRASNHGDITLQQGVGGGFAFSAGALGDDDVGLQPGEVAAITDWVTERGGTLAAYIQSSTVQVTPINAVTAGRPQFITSYFIDPHTYPPTADIIASDPAGVPLGDLFQGGNEVVISQNLAQSQRIAVGDRVRVSGTTDEFIVRGIIPTESEAGFRNLFAAFFGFAYFDIALAQPLSINPNPNSISLTLPEDQRPATRDQANALVDELRALLQGRSGRANVSFTTVPQLLEQNQQIADITGRFVVVMGLGAMLIGGVGIVNTMLVMVRRRTEEIAALKTFGLKGRQVALLFMAEALILGLAGSLVGAVIGVLLSGLANAYGETLIQQRLVWRLHPEAVVFGLVLGLIVTAVFGVLPVLTAVRIRPGIILRPNETHVPTAGVLSSIAALLFVVLALGLIAGQIIGSTIFGLIGVAVTLLVLGVLVCLLWVVVWVVGRLPAFGSVDLRLALRNLRARRLRTATTLLALSAGMFALSSITFFGAGVREILQTTLSGSLGGNVLIFSVLPGAIANPIIDSRLDSLTGVQSRTRILTYQASIVGINGQEVDSAAAVARRQEILEEMRTLRGGLSDIERAAALGQELQALPSYSLTLSVRDTTGDNIGGADSISAGRGLTPEDRGQPVMVIHDTELQRLGVPVGAALTLQINSGQYELTVVGTQGNTTARFGDAAVPPGVLPRSAASDFGFNLAQVDPAYLDNVLLELSAIPLVFSIDVTFHDGLLRRFIDQFSALPILVGLLSLGAAAVIMANTVALATLERRRQIGILKAVGLKGRRVLGVMLLENILVSLIGALLGIGLSALILTIASLVPSLGLAEILLVVVPAEAVPVALALLAGAIGIGVLATVLSAQVAIGERALNVLRYE